MHPMKKHTYLVILILITILFLVSHKINENMTEINYTSQPPIMKPQYPRKNILIILVSLPPSKSNSYTTPFRPTTKPPL
jgi:uncharacterized integral membrane protein